MDTISASINEAKATLDLESCKIAKEEGVKEAKTSEDEVRILKLKLQSYEKVIESVKTAIIEHADEIDAALNETMPALRETTSEELLANRLLIGMDKATHSGMVEKLSNDCLFG